jgi:hypothetical protein
MGVPPSLLICAFNMGLRGVFSSPASLSMIKAEVSFLTRCERRLPSRTPGTVSGTAYIRQHVEWRWQMDPERAACPL